MSIKNGCKVIGLSLILGLNTLAFAEDTADTSNDNPESPPSFDEFMSTFMELVPKEVCNGFKGDAEVWPIMTKKNITLEKCTELTTQLTKDCVQKYKDKLPENFDNQTLNKWAKDVGYCIGLDYASKYIYNDDYTNTDTSTNKAEVPKAVEEQKESDE